MTAFTGETVPFNRPVVALTAHPLQRIGAYALACLVNPQASRPEPETVTATELDAAIELMTRHAVDAALGRDAKDPRHFFLKCSLSIFPNSPMLHPSNARRSDDEITQRVRVWRRPPPAGRRPPDGVPCVLCGRGAAGFYGKMDIPLAESDAYRNTTPRGHEGMALCWPCVCCFHALPYGCWLTGGPLVAIHSWDEDFLAALTANQVRSTRQLIEYWWAAQPRRRAWEALGLLALRRYQHPVRDGMQLMVVSNNNRGPNLQIFRMDQHLAEWLRDASQNHQGMRGFRALLHANRTSQEPGYIGLARIVFRNAGQVPAVCARYLTKIVTEGGRLDEPRWGQAADLAALCFDYANKVMFVDAQDRAEVEATAARLVALLMGDRKADDHPSGQLTRSRLTEFITNATKPAWLRVWLQQAAVRWVLDPQLSQQGPLVTTRGFELLFDPGDDGMARFHRDLFQIAVIQRLCAIGWQPDTELPEPGLPVGDELDVEDDKLAAGDPEVWL